METTNFNATLDCIMETTTFSEKIFTNICTGQVSVVPMGFWQFFVIYVAILFLLAILIGFFVMVKNETSSRY